jgi:hypothetical protein
MVKRAPAQPRTAACRGRAFRGFASPTLRNLSPSAAEWGRGKGEGPTPSFERADDGGLLKIRN